MPESLYASWPPRKRGRKAPPSGKRRDGIDRAESSTILFRLGRQSPAILGNPRNNCFASYIRRGGGRQAAFVRAREKGARSPRSPHQLVVFLHYATRGFPSSGFAPRLVPYRFPSLAISLDRFPSLASPTSSMTDAAGASCRCLLSRDSRVKWTNFGTDDRARAEPLPGGRGLMGPLWGSARTINTD